MTNKKDLVLSVFIVLFLVSAMSLFAQGRFKVVQASCKDDRLYHGLQKGYGDIR
jgi:hypothetical protein